MADRKRRSDEPAPERPERPDEGSNGQYGLKGLGPGGGRDIEEALETDDIDPDTTGPGRT
jgi:hypothetical protein